MRAASPAAPDKLDAIRDVARQLRDKEKEILDLDERLKATKAEVLDLKHKKLVDLMQEAGVDKIGLPAEGNYPPSDAVLSPYYHAVIAANWEPERRQAAFNWLESEGHGDLVKTVVTVAFGRDERQRAREITQYLELMGVQHSVQLDVPWNTLTAFVREQVEKYHRVPPLETIGATVGQVVKLKPRKT
jgi:hypothetical protein